MRITYYQLNQILVTEDLCITNYNFEERARKIWGIVKLDPLHSTFSYDVHFATPGHETMFRLKYAGRI